MGNKNPIWDAEDYNKSNGSQYRDAKETIEQIIKDGANKADMVIVDIGCGSGNVTKILSSSLSTKKIFASDFDAKMINFAKEQSKDEKIEYFVQDISVPWELLDDRLKSLEGKVDLVWSNRVLHWVPDKETAVKTIARLLKPGGMCYINTTLQRDLKEFLDEGEETEDCHEKYFDFLTHKEQSQNWKSYFEKSGLSRVDIDLREKSWVWDTEEHRMQMYSFAEPYLKMIATESWVRLAEKEKDNLLKAMKDKFIKSSQTPYGKNPNGFVQDNKRKAYYEQFRIVGVK